MYTWYNIICIPHTAHSKGQLTFNITYTNNGTYLIQDVHYYVKLELNNGKISAKVVIPLHQLKVSQLDVLKCRQK